MKDEFRDLSSFNQRLDSWVMGQGILFHLTHGGSGRGLVGKLIAILIKLGLLALICLAFFWVYTIYAGGGQKVLENRVQSVLMEHFDAEEVLVSGISREKGKLIIDKISIQGGAESFFDTLSLRGLKCDRSRLIDVGLSWDAGKVSIGSLSVALRAGADEDAEFTARFERLFRNVGDVSFREVTVGRLSADWGYGPHTRGRLDESKAVVTQEAQGDWKLVFTGGTMSQTWVKEASLTRAVLTLSQEKGIQLSEGEAELNGGGMTFGLSVSNAAIPQFNGAYTIDKADIRTFLPGELKRMFSGMLSGKGKIEGSPNSSSGVVTSFLATIDEEAPLHVLSRFPLIEALRAIDTNNSYYKVGFTSGGFKFLYKEGTVEISDLQVEAPGIMTVKGSAVVRKRNEDELVNLLGQSAEDLELLRAENAIEDAKLTLSKAGKATGDDLFSQVRSSGQSAGGLEDLKDELERDVHRSLISERKVLGDLMVTLPENVFSNSPRLRERFPRDTGGEAVELMVRMDDPLDEVTQRFSNGLIQLSGSLGANR